MRSTATRRTPLSAANSKRLDELCAWIVENPDQTLGWSQMAQKSGFTKEQLIQLHSLTQDLAHAQGQVDERHRSIFRNPNP